MITNVPTTLVSIDSNTGASLGYAWSEIETTWANSDFTWNNVEQQSAPAGTAITNIQIS